MHNLRAKGQHMRRYLIFENLNLCNINHWRYWQNIVMITGYWIIDYISVSVSLSLSLTHTHTHTYTHTFIHTHVLSLTLGDELSDTLRSLGDMRVNIHLMHLFHQESYGMSIIFSYSIFHWINSIPHRTEVIIVIFTLSALGYILNI